MVLTIENIGTRKEEFRWQELTRDVEQYLPVIAVSTGLRFADLLRTNYGLQLLMPIEEASHIRPRLPPSTDRPTGF